MWVNTSSFHFLTAFFRDIYPMHFTSITYTEVENTGRTSPFPVPFPLSTRHAHFCWCYSFIFANTPEGVRRKTLIVDQAKTSSRLLYFGPGQQLQAEAKCVSACHWSMKYTQVPNFIPRHFLISESANCPFLLCFAQDGTHQEQLWKPFYRQLSLSQLQGRHLCSPCFPHLQGGAPLHRKAKEGGENQHIHI